MKFSKLLPAAVAVLGLATATGFNHNLVKADTVAVQTSVPDKDEIVREINQQSPQSGRVDFTVDVKTWEMKHHKHKTENIIYKGTTIFSHRGNLIHDVVRSGKDKIYFWSTPNTIYAKDDKKWGKFSLGKDLKSESPDRIEMGIVGLALRAYNAMQISDNGSNYVLTLANHPRLNHKLWLDMIKREKMDKDMASDFRQIKLTNYTLRAIYDKNSYQLLGANFHMAIQRMGLTTTGTVSNVNAYNNLHIPLEVVKHAKKEK